MSWFHILKHETKSNVNPQKIDKFQIYLHKMQSSQMWVAFSDKCLKDIKWWTVLTQWAGYPQHRTCCKQAHWQRFARSDSSSYHHRRLILPPSWCSTYPHYAVGTGWGMVGGWACSGLVPFCSEMGVVGRISSLGSTMLTWSGRGFLGPILPLGSQGSMIFTLIPSTPKKGEQVSKSHTFHTKFPSFHWILLVSFSDKCL